MSQSWTELLRVADSNSRSAADKLQEESRRREKLKQKPKNTRPVNEQAINIILERRRREQQQQKQAEEQRLKKANEAKKQQKAIIQFKKPDKPEAVKPSPTPSTNSTIKPKKPPPSYEELMRYASFNANKKSIPKELRHIAESARENKSSTPTVSSFSSSSTTKSSKIPPTPVSKSNTTTNVKKPNSSTTKNSSTAKPPVPSKSSSLTKPGAPAKNTKPQIRSAVNPTSNGHKPTIPPPPASRLNNAHKPTIPPPPANRLNNGHKPTIPPPPASRLNNGYKPMLPPNRTLNGNKPPLPVNRPINGHRPAIAPSRKRPVDDTDDEEDDEDMRDFIVDDDDDDNNNGVDYRKELHETLKTNFRFDHEKYSRRILDDDDDDLRHMESSFDQIEQEEAYSRQQGREDDIKDVLRDEAEKKKRLLQTKKRSKTSA